MGDAPLLAGGAEYVTALRLSSLIASSSARASACHRNVELRSDRKLCRLLAENEELLAGRWCGGYGESGSEWMDCNSPRFCTCLRCLMIRKMTPQRAKNAMTAAIMTPATVAGCEKSLEICKGIFRDNTYCDLRWVRS